MRGETRARPPSSCWSSDFNPLPSCEGRHMGYFDKQEIINISIHSPHARGDEGGETMFGNATVFQSTPLTRGETCKARHALRDRRISIHSPHARGDTTQKSASNRLRYFNPLPSCEGRLWADKTSADEPQISIHSPYARGDMNAKMTIATQK